MDIITKLSIVTCLLNTLLATEVKANTNRKITVYVKIGNVKQEEKK